MTRKANAGVPARWCAALAIVSLAASAAAGRAETGGVPGATPQPPRELSTDDPGPGGSRPAATPRSKILCVSRTREGREFFAAALAAKEIEPRVGGPEIIPDSLRELIPYDCIILSNLPRSSLGDRKMRMLVRYVRDYGGGLVVLGGPGSLGPAYKGTPLEEILPVAMGTGGRFGKKEALPLCIVLLIDKSGSMGEGFRGKIMAERASAEELVQQLRPEDMLGIIAFDAVYGVLVPLEPVGDDRKGTIELIDRIQPGGGTCVSKPLEEALRQMENSPCRVKHLILVTDGMTKDVSHYDYRGLIREYVRSGVTISAIDIGPKWDSDFLRALATGTGGDYTRVKDVKELPLTVLRDAREAAMESGLLRETIVPKLGGNSPLLKGIRRRQIPEVRGYSVMEAKSGADVALYSDVRGAKDPLLAAWRCGHGKTVAWTSDAEGHWAGGAGAAKKSGVFWARLVRWAMRSRGTLSLPTSRARR